jgi:hypothetical protein
VESVIGRAQKAAQLKNKFHPLITAGGALFWRLKTRRLPTIQFAIAAQKEWANERASASLSVSESSSAPF